MLCEHPTLRIDMGDIERLRHEAGVHRAAGGKRHDDRWTAASAGSRGAHAEQTLPESPRHHDAHPAPTELRHRALDRRRLAAVRHTTTPGLHGSITTVRTCLSASGAPTGTPANSMPVGQGVYTIVHR